VTPTAEELIGMLNLRPLPVEGGFYRESYRSDLLLPAASLAPRYAEARTASTAIYYLLTSTTFSALHRLPADEVYHFYLGDPVELVLLDPSASDGSVVTLGAELTTGQRPQALAPRGVWQGSALKPGGRVALLGTTVAPGFEFADYEAGDRAALLAAFPGFSERIRLLTRS
jgi:predicted cupin superfamily sugar epimerase